MGDEAAEEKETITVTLPEAMTMATVAPKVVKPKGPPVLPWMRNPIEIGVHESQLVNEVPRLDPRFVGLHIDLLCWTMFQLRVWLERIRV